MATPGLSRYRSLTEGVEEVSQFMLPQLTTAERDNLVAVNGMMIYNSTTATIQARAGGVWVSL